MKFLKKLKAFFTFDPNPDCPKNFCKCFTSFDEVVKYIPYINQGFGRHYVYYYLGESTNLANLISQPYGNGEKDIPDISLEYVGESSIKGNNVVLRNTPFFPDMIGDIEEKYHKLDRNNERKVLYKTDSGRMVAINSFVLAKENMYICSK